MHAPVVLLAWLSQFFLARVSRSTNVNPGTGKQIVGAPVDDVISRSTDWRKTSQVRLPTSASRHNTHRQKNCRTLRRGKNLPFGSKSVSLRVKTFARKGTREGNGSAAMDTLSIRTVHHNTHGHGRSTRIHT